ncbi:MAG: hypothetical protein NVS4B6_18280 [Mycobacterium sp.]
MRDLDARPSGGGCDVANGDKAARGGVHSAAGNIVVEECPHRQPLHILGVYNLKSTAVRRVHHDWCREPRQQRIVDVTAHNGRAPDRYPFRTQLVEHRLDPLTAPITDGRHEHNPAGEC